MIFVRPNPWPLTVTSEGMRFANGGIINGPHPTMVFTDECELWSQETFKAVVANLPIRHHPNCYMVVSSQC